MRATSSGRSANRSNGTENCSLISSGETIGGAGGIGTEVGFTVGFAVGLGSISTGGATASLSLSVGSAVGVVNSTGSTDAARGVLAKSATAAVVVSLSVSATPLEQATGPEPEELLPREGSSILKVAAVGPTLEACRCPYTAPGGTLALHRLVQICNEHSLGHADQLL